ncbi:MAG: GNAT family N-acetyltransferase [Myxococcales bacterium]|nr:GNAT family N-acetyltransferase [Myxococcales bacterium]
MTDADGPTLQAIYASTRAEELAQVPWPTAQKQAFLAMQFHAQHTHYQRAFADAAFDLLEVEGAPIGRLYVHRRTDEIRVVDIALLPAWRGRGVGGALLAELITEAHGRGVPVKVHVERNNPAQRLYARLGFVEEGGDAVYRLLACAPPG